jgi:hypothetical protein
VEPLVESMVVTYGVRYMPLLERLVVESPKMSKAGGLTPKNLNIECASSILLGSVKRLAESMVVTYGVRCVFLLGEWVVGNPQTSGAGLTPKIQILSTPAWYHWGYETVHGEHGGNLWGKVFALIREVGGREPKIEWGKGIDPQNRIF